MSPEQSDPSTSDLAPIFCGGTERSGTTIVARLVAAHPAYALVPIEARFHTDARGLPDLLAGRIELAEFRRRMRRVWYRRKLRNGGLRGMFRFLPEERFEATLERFCSDFAQEPLPAARGLVNGLFGPVVEAKGAAAWIEMTPPNVLAASTLVSIFPEMRLLHAVRDPRDFACSILPLQWGPDNIVEAIAWWGEQMRDAHAALASMPPERVLVVRLHELALTARRESYQRLLSFLELPDHPDMRRFFAESALPGSAHIGRWRHELVGEQRVNAVETAQEVTQRLTEAGVTFLPERPDRALVTS